MRSLRRGFDAVLCAGFALALVAPALDRLLRPEALADVRLEEREAEPLPAPPRDLAALEAFPRGFEAWAGDRLGLRDVLLRIGSRARYQLFGVSPSPRVVAGRDGWLFLASIGILEAQRGLRALDETRLERWRTALESRRAFCESLGAQYVFAIAPEKSTLYPEFLPAGYERLAGDGQRGARPLDQLVAWLEQRSDLRILDLREPLERAKARDQGSDLAYYRLGTHWTDRGLHAAYARILEQLSGRFPALTPRPASSFEWAPDPLQGDSWAGRLRLDGVLTQEARVIRSIEGGYDCELGRSDRAQREVWTLGEDPSAPRLVFLHDSFGDRMRKLLAPHFAHSHMAWRADFDPAAVARERPDVVVQLCAERVLWTEKPVPVRAPGEQGLRRAFEAGTLLVRLDAARPDAVLRPVGGTRIGRAAEGVEVEQVTGADMLELVDAGLPAGAELVLRVEFEAPSASWVDVLYRTRARPSYRHGQTFSAPTHAGSNAVLIELADPELLGPLRLRLGRGSGRFTLRALELRALGG